MKFSLKLAYHEVFFSAAWCKRSLIYDQTIEDINIFSPAFLIELRGVAQLTPLSPTLAVDHTISQSKAIYGSRRIMTTLYR